MATAERLRVCHFCASRGMGRGDVYIDLINRMAETRPELELALLVPHGAVGMQRVHPRVTVLHYRDGGRSNPLVWWDIAKQLKTFKPNLVHTHFAKATAIYRWVHKRLRVPSVATKHNPRHGAAFNRAPQVIAVSQAVKASITHDRVAVIPNGILPPPRITPAPATTPRDPRTPLKLINIGRLETIKGQKELIETLARCDEPWELTILGQGPQRGALEALCTQLGVTDQVHLLGHQTDVLERLAQCDAFVQASHSEGFGIALLEAMYAAPIAISTPVGLAAEVFPDWLIWDPHLDEPNTAALDALFADPHAMAQRFAQWVEPVRAKYHLDQTIAAHVDLYRRVAKSAAACV